MTTQDTKIMGLPAVTLLDSGRIEPRHCKGLQKERERETEEWT